MVATLGCGGGSTRTDWLAPAPGCADDPAALGTAQARARAWLRVVPFTPRVVQGAPPTPPARHLAPTPDTPYAMVLSYPDGPARMRRRSYLYDAALAILWFGSTGEIETARSLANTLILLQNPDGSWGFFFDADGFYNLRYVRNGAVAWAAYALAWLDLRAAHPPARQAAQAAIAYLAAQRVADPGARHAGLLLGGRGRWAVDEERFFPDFELPVAITEHQLDAYQAFSLLAPRLADDLAARVIEVLWLEGAGRFAVAADARAVIDGASLDAAGAWGALWLEARGDVDRARRSLRFTEATFRLPAPGVAAYRPALEGAEPPAPSDLVFVEGSLGVGLAAWRLGDRATARGTLELATRFACHGGPGVPYANAETPDFTTAPAAASTLWFLMLAREATGGEPAPVFVSGLRAQARREEVRR